MKFNCPQCNKPYLIADERVRGKILKIRCKNCSTVISVREGMEQGGPPGRRGKPPSSLDGGRAISEPASVVDPMELSGRDLRRPETPQRLSSVMFEVDEDALPPPDDEWYVSVDGVQEGPFSLERARDWVASRGSEDEVYCWRDTFSDWLPIEDVPELQNARRVSKLALRAPPVGPTPSPNAMRSVAERSRSAANPDLFGAAEDESMTTIDPRPFAAMAERPPQPAPAPAPAPADEPLMRLIVGDDDGAPAPARPPAPALPSERPVLPRPLSMPAIASANPIVDPSQAAPRAWLSDALSGPQPALRLPSPYPTTSNAFPSGLPGEPAPLAPAGSGKRVFLIIVLLLALIGSGAGAYVLVRKFVRPDGEGALPPDDTTDSKLPPLRPEDVSAALQRAENQAALKQCYERARKADPAMAIGRIDIDLAVSPEGNVTDVVLSQHADTEFGTCLTESIRAWKFDASASGVTARVPLIFGS
ncbi:MAG TPA: GYF domain-containing protein [Haliangium sp.]|nr:GYF domain-containing protein [Haliangium sp.]